MTTHLNYYTSDNSGVHRIKTASDVFVHFEKDNKSLGVCLSGVEEFSQVSTQLEQYFGALKNIKVKVIGPYLLNRQIQRKISSVNIDIEKAIYCKSFELYYEPTKAAIKLQKKEYSKINVLVVDDSKSIREIIIKTFSTDPRFNVVGEMENGQNLAEKISTLDVHMMTLDMQMPVVNGVLALKQFFPSYPIPAIIVSAVSLEDGSLAMEAMDSGAFDYLQKPLFDKLEQFKIDLLEKAYAAFESKYHFKELRTKSLVNIKFENISLDLNRIIAIGSSTGGTEALREVLIKLPKNIPPILIVQHIPAGFSKAFADRMNTLCPFEVKEASHNDEVKAGVVLVAPGGKQMGVLRKDNKYYIKITEDDPVNRHRPSVDYLFLSLLEVCQQKIVSVILTGMGDDGARAMKKLKDIGASTIAQNEESCIIYGMPQAAVKLGCIDHILHLRDIPNKIIELVTLRSRTKQDHKKAV